MCSVFKSNRITSTERYIAKLYDVTHVTDVRDIKQWFRFFDLLPLASSWVRMSLQVWVLLNSSAKLCFEINYDIREENIETFAKG